MGRGSRRHVPWLVAAAGFAFVAFLPALAAWLGAARPRARPRLAPRPAPRRAAGAGIPLEEFGAYAERLAGRLSEADPASPLQLLLSDAGPESEWADVADWRAGRHYMILVDDASGDVLGWAWVEEEAEWWTLQNIWIDGGSRRGGLGRHLMHYVESATQYMCSQRNVPSQLRLAALGPSEGFYVKLGYPRLGGCVFGKDVVSSCSEFAPIHKSSRVFRPPNADAQACRPGSSCFPTAAAGFRLHVVPVA